MQVIGGKVSFKRSYQPEQYGSKGAEVEISFSMTEGEELGTKLDDVAALVKAKALALCNIKTEGTANMPADVAKAAPVAPKVELKPGNGSLKPRTKADLEKEAKAALKAEPEGEDLGGFDESAAELPDVSDLDLSNAMNRVVDRLKKDPKIVGAAPKMVKELIQTFKPAGLAADMVFTSKLIPQKMRHMFLKKLEELK